MSSFFFVGGRNEGQHEVETEVLPTMGLVLYLKCHSCVRLGTWQICPFGASYSLPVGLMLLALHGDHSLLLLLIILNAKA